MWFISKCVYTTVVGTKSPFCSQQSGVCLWIVATSSSSTHRALYPFSMEKEKKKDRTPNCWLHTFRLNRSRKRIEWYQRGYEIIFTSDFNLEVERVWRKFICINGGRWWGRRGRKSGHPKRHTCYSNHYFEHISIDCLFSSPGRIDPRLPFSYTFTLKAINRSHPWHSTLGLNASSQPIVDGNVG